MTPIVGQKFQLLLPGSQFGHVGIVHMVEPDRFHYYHLTSDGGGTISLERAMELETEGRLMWYEGWPERA